MTKPAMVGEVNKLVASLLAANQPLFFPGVGTLRPERKAAKRLSRRRLAPPYRTVEYTSREEGLAMPGAIARAARCDEERAATVYERWLSYVYTDGVLTIEGVGTLRRKHFALDPVFEQRLNPQGHEPIRIRRSRRFDWVLWFGVAAILFAGGFWGYQFLRLRGIVSPDGVRMAVVGTQPVPVPTEAVRTDASAAGTDGSASDAAPGPAEVAAGPTGGATETVPAPAVSDATETAPAADAAERARTAVPADGAAADRSALVSGRRYVVLGVFSTPGNAERAAQDAAKRVAGIRCAVHPFGAKWMVSPFASDDAAACARFVNEYGDRFPDLWVYAAR